MAATLEKGLNRAAVLNADIAKLVRLISRALSSRLDEEQTEPLNIRISSLLYYGLVKIYSRKTKLLYEEIRDFQTRIILVCYIFFYSMYSILFFSHSKLVTLIFR